MNSDENDEACATADTDDYPDLRVGSQHPLRPTSAARFREMMRPASAASTTAPATKHASWRRPSSVAGDMAHTRPASAMSHQSRPRSAVSTSTRELNETIVSMIEAKPALETGWLHVTEDTIANYSAQGILSRLRAERAENASQREPPKPVALPTTGASSAETWGRLWRVPDRFISKAVPKDRKRVVQTDADVTTEVEPAKEALMQITQIQGTFSKVDFLRSNRVARMHFRDSVLRHVQHDRRKLLELRAEREQRAHQARFELASTVQTETVALQRRAQASLGAENERLDAVSREQQKRQDEAYFRDALKASILLRQRQKGEAAKERRDGLLSWRMAKAIDDLQKPEFLRMRLFKEAELEMLQNGWLTFVTLALGLFELHDRFIGALNQRFLVAKKAQSEYEVQIGFVALPGAPRIMIAEFRSAFESIRRFTSPDVAMQRGVHHRERVRQVRALRTIVRIWREYRKRYFERKTVRSIRLIRRFFTDLGESHRIIVAVKKIVKCVRIVQHAARGVRLMRAARRQLCFLQMQEFVVQSAKQDEREIRKLRTSLKVHERELQQRRGMHRLAKQESMQKMQLSVDQQVAFITQRREMSKDFSDEMFTRCVDEVLAKREGDYGRQLLRFGANWRLFINATEGHVSRLSKKASPVPQNQTLEERAREVKPVTPHFRNLLTDDECTTIVMKCIELAKTARAKRAHAKELIGQSVPESSHTAENDF